MRLWSDARGWSNWVRGSWMRQDTPPREQESLQAFTTDGGNPGFQNLHRHWSLPPLLFCLPPHLVRCSFGMVASTRSAASKSWRRNSCYRLTDKMKYVQQQKRLGGRERSTKAFAWESSWGQREKSKRMEGEESKKAAIKAHNKDNDRRETQDLSRRLT